VDSGQLIIVKHTQKNVTHWQYRELAIEYDGRLGMIVERLDTKPWISIYRVLIGLNKIELGRGWIIPVDSYYREQTQIYRARR
jgi:hypothetical protein